MKWKWGFKPTKCAEDSQREGSDPKTNVCLPTMCAILKNIKTRFSKIQNIRFNKGDLVISIQVSAANDDTSNNNKIFCDIEHKHLTSFFFSKNFQCFFIFLSFLSPLSFLQGSEGNTYSSTVPSIFEDGSGIQSSPAPCANQGFRQPRFSFSSVGGRHPVPSVFEDNPVIRYSFLPSFRERVL